MDSTSLSYLHKNQGNTPENKHEAAHTLVKIIDNAASLSKNESQNSQYLPRFIHKRRKKKQKAWFDKDIQALKKKTNKCSNLNLYQPDNLDIQNSHKQSLKLYNDMCKSKRSAFRQERFDKMDKALFDNEELLKQFKHFSENRMPKCTASEKISAKNWKNHFKNFHSETRDQSIPSLQKITPQKA